MRKFKIILVFIILMVAVYFILRPSTKKLIADLDSKNHTTTKVKAAYKLGERKEKTAVVPLLTRILDPSTSTNLSFKGMTVCYAKLIALSKISGIQPPNELNIEVDTMAAKFYLNWAIKEGYIKSEKEIDLTYFH